jgi:hypothetical protein
MEQYEKARGYHEQKMAIAHELGDVSGYATGSLNLAVVLANQGQQLEQALTYARQARDTLERIGQTQYLQDAQTVIRQVEQMINQQKPNFLGRLFGKK